MSKQVKNGEEHKIVPAKNEVTDADIAKLKEDAELLQQIKDKEQMEAELAAEKAREEAAQALEAEHEAEIAAEIAAEKVRDAEKAKKEKEAKEKKEKKVKEPDFLKEHPADTAEEVLNNYLRVSKPMDKIIQLSAGGNYMASRTREIYVPISIVKKILKFEKK